MRSVVRSLATITEDDGEYSYCTFAADLIETIDWAAANLINPAAFYYLGWHLLDRINPYPAGSLEWCAANKKAIGNLVSKRHYIPVSNWRFSSVDDEMLFRMKFG